MKELWKKTKRLAKKAWMYFEKACKFIVKKVIEAAEWCTKHPEVVTVLCGAASGADWIIKKIRKTSTEREQDYQRTHIYDHSLGHHWTLKREMTSNEMYEYGRRLQNGENIGDILRSMRVLA